jgi:hypothetical protein
LFWCAAHLGPRGRGGGMKDIGGMATIAAMLGMGRQGGSGVNTA